MFNKVKFITVIFTMKSGSKLTFKCLDIKIQRNTSGHLESYEVLGLDKSKGDPIFFVSIKDIESISLKK